MTTQRDDTKDLLFRRGEIDRFFLAVSCNLTPPAILPWPISASLANDSRYVPYDQYAALEKERDELRATISRGIYIPPNGPYDNECPEGVPGFSYQG